MVQRTGDRPVPLTGLPEGLVAFPVQETRSDGIVVRTWRGREKLETVEIRARALRDEWTRLSTRSRSRSCWARSVDVGRRSKLTTAEILGPTTVGLVLRGAVTVRCRVDSASRLGAPISWTLTEAWDEERRRRAEVSTSAADAWQARAATAAEGVSALCPELAAALGRTRPGAATFPVLVHAAEDLAMGISHAGPRAFSQTHFGHTKAREDAASVLRAAGVPESIVVTLGLRRSDRIGVAGPIVALVDGKTVALALLDGPVLIRTDQRGLRLAFAAECPLVVVENLQAAEILADRFPAVALVYTAGLLGLPPSNSSRLSLERRSARSSPSTPMPVVFGLPNSSCRSCHRRCCSTRASSSIRLENRGVLTALPSRRFSARSTARPPHSPPRVFGAAIRSSRKRRLRRQSHLLCPVSARLIVTRVEVVAPNAGPYVRDVALGTRGAGYWSHVMPSSRRPPLFGVRPPHCLKKNGTLNVTQSSRTFRTH